MPSDGAPGQANLFKQMGTNSSTFVPTNANVAAKNNKLAPATKQQ